MLVVEAGEAGASPGMELAGGEDDGHENDDGHGSGGSVAWGVDESGARKGANGD